MEYGSARASIPPLTYWAKRLIIGHTVAYLLFVAFGRWDVLPVVAREMVLVPGTVHEGHVWQLITYILSFDNPGSFLMDMLMLWLFAGSLEVQIGSRRFIRFYFGMSFVSALLVTLLAFALDAVAQIPIFGPGGTMLALVVAWGMLNFEQTAYFFFVLPLKGKHFVLLSVAIVALFAFTTNPMLFVIHAFSAILAMIWAKRWVRIDEVWWRIRSAFVRWRARRARRHLKVMDGKDGRYLH